MARADAAHDDPADGRLDPAGERDPAEEVGDPVEALGVEEADQPTQHADQGEPEEMGRIGEVVAAGEAEQGREARSAAPKIT